MLSNSFRVLVDTDGKRYRFDRFAFNEALGAAKRTAKERDQMLSREFFQAFADALATSVSTITHWASGSNGPSDMGRVKDMAEFLGVDYKNLLLAEEQEDAMMWRAEALALDIKYPTVDCGGRSSLWDFRVS